MTGKSRTIDECRDIAQQYDARVRFKKGNSAAYYYARGKGWLDDICSHMIPLQESRTIEDCKIVAKKYITRIDFAKNDAKIYYYARHHGWLDDICEHMIPYFVFNRTKEECHHLALQYDRPIDFLRNHGDAYKKAQQEGWLQDIFSHMTYFYTITDLVYAWKVKDSDIWKIGVSNRFCVEERIKTVSNLHGFEIEVLYKAVVEKTARKVEFQLLSLGSKIDTIEKKTGWTEFRRLSNKDVETLTEFFQGKHYD
jgi:hypothetical protein